MDRRLTPANGRVADLSLAGRVQADSYLAGHPARINAPVIDLCPTEGGQRDRQLIWGDRVTVYERREGHAFVRSCKDGYVGYVAEAGLAEAREATHFVCSPATHLYAEEDIKSPDLAALSFGSRLLVMAERRKFWETPDGFVPKSHLRALDRPFADPVTVAQLFFGVPYLWGGNSIRGIDCSGLVQAALLACGVACPGDSDLQRESLGTALDDSSIPARGDLYFWSGHVGILVDPETLLHANAHHMAVAYEPIAKAIARIVAQDGGPVLTRKRL